MDAEFRVERARVDNRIDYPEIVEDLEGAWLDALPARTFEGSFGGIDQTERNAAACEIDRKSQTRWAGANNQDSRFVHCTNHFNGTVYECQSLKSG
jgi:hypothetical protein